MRTQLTEEELIFFAGYYELKYDREKKKQMQSDANQDIVKGVIV